MKHGQRPSRHYRRVKTKNGRRKVLVNPSIHKKVHKAKRRRVSQEEMDAFDNAPLDGGKSLLAIQRKKTFEEEYPDPYMEKDLKRVMRNGDIDSGTGTKTKGPRMVPGKSFSKDSSLSELGPEELIRRVRQQEQLNVARDKEDYKVLKPKIDAIKAENRQKAEEEAKAREEARSVYWAGQKAYKQLKVLEKIGHEMERKRSIDSKSAVYDDRGVAERIERAMSLAQDSRDPGLINSAKDLQNYFDKERNEQRYDKNEMAPVESKLFKAGKTMLSMPEQKKIIDLTGSPSMSQTEWEQHFRKELSPLSPKTQKEILDSQPLQVAIRTKDPKLLAEARGEAMRQAKEARREMEKTEGFGANQRNIVKEDIVKYKKMLGDWK